MLGSSRRTRPTQMPAPSKGIARSPATVTDPARTGPAAMTDPAVADPAVADPAVADPAMTDPAMTDPGVTDPAHEPADRGWRPRPATRRGPAGRPTCSGIRSPTHPQRQQPDGSGTGGPGGQRGTTSRLQGHTTVTTAVSGLTLDRQTRVIPDGVRAAGEPR